MGWEVCLALPVFFPFAAGLAAYAAGARGAGERAADGQFRQCGSGEGLRDALVIAAAVLECAGVAALAVKFAGAAGGGPALALEIPEVCGFGLSFVLDGFRAVYCCVAAFLWVMASLFSGEYFAGHGNCGRFQLFWLWTLGAVMGVFLSADLFTTFLFFEVMSFTSYVWVAQEEDGKALRAAATYLAVAVTGGMVMLMGIFLLYHTLGTLVIRELPAAAAGCGDKGILYAAGACMLFGFGAKAGAFPLHIWLPKAHPAAPAPASALLSGILTKVGIYGILVISCGLFPGDRPWGSLILGTGTVTMLGGAVLALFSVDLKRTLAASSMSQIGFILVGIGMQGLLGEEGGTAAYGTFLHMVNHSLIKLVLFLAAGVVHRNTHALNLNDIRGFGRRKPLLGGIFLAGALTIGGFPLLGGYVSKTLIHEGIVEYGGDAVLRAVEWLFLFSGGLTVAYMAKLFVALFVERNGDAAVQEKYDGNVRYWRPMTAFALAGSAAVLPAWGGFPHGVMAGAAELAGDFLGPEGAVHAAALYSRKSLSGGMVSIGIGAAVYLLFVRKVLFRKREDGTREYVDLWPRWLDLEEGVYRPVLLRALPAMCGVLCRVMDCFVDTLVVALRRTIYRDSPLPYKRPEGNLFTESLGRVLNTCQGVANRTWRKDAPVVRDYVHLAAVKEEEIRETNYIIRRSLSFGLMLVCIGLALTLVYLIWW